MSNTPPSQRRWAVLWTLPEFTLCAADPEPAAEINRRRESEVPLAATGEREAKPAGARAPTKPR